MRLLIALWVIFFILAGGPAGSQEPEQKFQGFNLQGYDENGEKAWSVKGDTADIVGSEIVLSNVDAESFGDQPMNVRARTGNVDQVKGTVHLKQDVVITGNEGQQLMTDSLDWNREQDLVATEDEVTIIDDQMKVVGKGLKAQPGLKTVQLKEDVTVMIDAQEEGKAESHKITITSEGPMEIDQAQSIATFTDHVVAIQKGQTLRSDQMTIHFNKDLNQVSEMVCSGNVVIEKGENISYADQVVYDARTQKLTLSGRPKLILMTEGSDLFATSGN